MDKNVIYRSIPKVDLLLEHPEISALICEYGRETVVEIIREKTASLRSFAEQCEDGPAVREKAANIAGQVKEAVKQLHECKMKPVVNATGIILHTNLGRAPISMEHGEQIKEMVTGYSNLEYHLETGGRGERYSHFEQLICRITGAEAAIAVNNNAAAVILILNTLTKGREVIVSRGELVEIGGKFRMPEVMEQSGSRLVEVGTTNKTYAEDYENAIHEETGALLKVHTSNYQVVGFTESVPLKEAANLAEKYGIPLIEDLGSGVLIDLSRYGLSHEPTVQDELKQGASVVCFSGDKLLGGPQAGIIVGKKEYLDQMKRNPLMRAFRIDKFTACALELIFREYLNPENAARKIPVLEMIGRPLETLTAMAEQLKEALIPISDKADVMIADCDSRIGGGALPAEELESRAVLIAPFYMTVTELEEKLRKAPHPIIVRIVGGRIQIDLRTLLKEDLRIAADTLTAILKGEK